MDDETAIEVVDRTVEVVSEGNWKLFNPRHRVAQCIRDKDRRRGSLPSHGGEPECS